MIRFAFEYALSVVDFIFDCSSWPAGSIAGQDEGVVQK